MCGVVVVLGEVVGDVVGWDWEGEYLVVGIVGLYYFDVGVVD